MTEELLPEWDSFPFQTSETYNIIPVGTPLYPQKFALTSPTSGGRSVGIVRSRTKATELVGLLEVIVWNSTVFVPMEIIYSYLLTYFGGWGTLPTRITLAIIKSVGELK
jgi:hypothetical protein